MILLNDRIILDHKKHTVEVGELDEGKELIKPGLFFKSPFKILQ